MAGTLKIPTFASEQEEAQWWFDHREETGQALVEASRQGRNGEGSLGRHARKIQERTSKASTQITATMAER